MVVRILWDTALMLGWLNWAHVYDALDWTSSTIVPRNVRVEHNLEFCQEGCERSRSTQTVSMGEFRAGVGLKGVL